MKSDDGNSQNFLFEMGRPVKPLPKERCRQCRMAFRHDWNKRWMYCGNQRSKRTGNGYRKIKPMDAACPAFIKNELE